MLGPPVKFVFSIGQVHVVAAEYTLALNAEKPGIFRYGVGFRTSAQPAFFQ